MVRKNIVLMTKLKNALAKLDKDLVIELHNISVNGVMRGCSGFIMNNENKTVVYVNTEQFGYSDKYLYRYAKTMCDYTGLTNRYAGSFDELVRCIDSALEKSGEDIR